MRLRTARRGLSVPRAHAWIEDVDKRSKKDTDYGKVPTLKQQDGDKAAARAEVKLNIDAFADASNRRYERHCSLNSKDTKRSTTAST